MMQLHFPFPLATSFLVFTPSVKEYYCQFAYFVADDLMSLYLITTAQVPRKSTSERFPSKEEKKGQLSSKSPMDDNKLQICTKRINGDSVYSDKANKQRTPAGRKLSSEAANNGMPGNMTKLSVNSRRPTDGNVSWTALPLSLAKLGKV